MPKQCTHPGCLKNVFGKGYCKDHQWKRTDRKPKAFKPTKKIKPVSKKLSKALKIYSELRKEFLQRPENMFCAVYPSIPSEEIHHMAGRGKNLNDTSTWLAVSRIGHMWIHENVKLATERGFMRSRLQLIIPLNEE